jgi:hypothetical protein
MSRFAAGVHGYSCHTCLTFSACFLILLALRIHLLVFQSRNKRAAGQTCLQPQPVSNVVCVLLSLPRLLPSLLPVTHLALQTPLPPQTVGMIQLTPSLPSSWVPPLCPCGRFLVPAFPVEVPSCLACLMLPTRSTMMRFPFFAYMSLPPLGLLPVLLLPRLPTVMIKFPFHGSHIILLWFHVHGDSAVPSLRPSLSRLCSSPSSPIVGPQPDFCPQRAPQAGSRSRCPLGYD